MRTALVLIALAFGAPALAASAVSERELRDIQARFGDCVVRKHHSDASKFVLNPMLHGKEFRRLKSRLVDGSCLLKSVDSLGGVRMSFPLDTMRYALADALVRREFAAAPASAIERAAPLAALAFDAAEFEPKPGTAPSKAELEELVRNRDRRLAMVFLSQYGECVVRANAADSHRLLLSDPATPAESAAFNALSPQMGNCLTGAQSVSLNKTALRGTIAMNYYRLAHAPRLATPGGSAN